MLQDGVSSGRKGTMNGCLGEGGNEGLYGSVSSELLTSCNCLLHTADGQTSNFSLLVRSTVPPASRTAARSAGVMMSEDGPVEEGATNNCHISVKISPVRRLCRRENSEEAEESEGESECVVACPQVLKQLCPTFGRSSPIKGCGSHWTVAALEKLRESLVVLPYWRRCLCSQHEVPIITELELLPLLTFTPPHRFIVIIVTNSSESLGSVVVGGESLVGAVYAAQNLPGLRPCIQSPSEPSLAFVRYDTATRTRTRRKGRRGTPGTLLNGGRVQVGMILIYQKTQMLYSGFPLSSYGCQKQDFLSFISRHAQYNFHLRLPDPEAITCPDSDSEPDPDPDL
ncbi:hypothetical protein Pcinc_022652 [Petrolisthes cinctipes]|uniref:Uncharacterized protein n=1 Tax=Petrolisthes cinctipes TaxID=88211 RepID=A0AAE1KFK5_PETCI|nr:hypothetical protein Pcinc_022652 [Petrolisthes cinctipes]